MDRRAKYPTDKTDVDERQSETERREDGCAMLGDGEDPEDAIERGEPTRNEGGRIRRAERCTATWSSDHVYYAGICRYCGLVRSVPPANDAWRPAACIVGAPRVEWP